MTGVTTKRSLTEREMLIESLRWEEIPCGPDGCVALVDIMGGDHSVVQAARVSHGQDARNALGELADDDAHLIRFLMRHRHSTPFEMAEIKFFVRCPMDVWRQWIRHRTASVNEYSTRYKPAINSMATTEPDKWRLQSQNLRQGSAGFIEDWPEGWRYEDGVVYSPNGNSYSSIEDISTPGKLLTSEEDTLQDKARRVYDERLALGVAFEQARKDLPLSTYTEAYWKIDLHNLFHFLGLRLAEDAQGEIREFAHAMAGIVQQLFPICYAAFMDYRRNAVVLSSLDCLAITNMQVASAKLILNMSTQESGGWGPEDYGAPYSPKFFREFHDIPDWKTEKCRERDECLAKLQKIGIVHFNQT